MYTNKSDVPHVAERFSLGEQREFMKVFVPMSDATLGANGEVCQQLVPFDPAFLNEIGRAHV